MQALELFSGIKKEASRILQNSGKSLFPFNHIFYTPEYSISHAPDGAGRQLTQFLSFARACVTGRPVSISTEAKYLTPQPWLSVSNLNLSGYQYHSASLICLYSFSTSSLTASPSEKALALPAATPMRKACS